MRIKKNAEIQSVMRNYCYNSFDDYGDYKVYRDTNVKPN